MDKKIKVLMLGDMIFSPSGVGVQGRNFAEALLNSGKFQIRQLSGAIKHVNYQPLKTDKYGEDLICFPCDGFGSPEIVRSMMRLERPDIIFLISDPRFYSEWLFPYLDEIRPLVPITYWNIWDNWPCPTFNKPYYESMDYLFAISKVTNDILDKLVPHIPHEQVPHAVDDKIFKPLSDDVVLKFRNETFNKLPGDENKVIFFYNSRNARRKMTGSIVWWFNDFLNEIGRDKATLILHTDPLDENGTNLEAMVKELDLTKGQVLFSREKIPPEGLAMIYGMADCLIDISDAEGWGLSTHEALSCGTPVIATVTGGMQEQITDGVDTFGVGIEPVSKAVIGSLSVPWIYEDRICKEDFIKALHKIYNMPKQDRKALGLKGHKHITTKFNFDKFNERWVQLMLEVHDRFGSWETRKNYKRFDLKEIK